MKQTSFRTTVLLAITALATALLGPVAEASPRTFWTADAMRAAVPMDKLLKIPALTPKQVARGESVIIPRSVPNGGGAWTGGGQVTHTAGRVFFLFNGQKASCSGDAVTSTNGSVVVTAGHCVKYQGTWHTQWIFVPGYDNGNAPFGQWPAKATLTTPQWEASEDINYDVGMAVVDSQNGRRLTDVVGAQGIAFNQPKNQVMYTFGYPAAAPYDGTKLIYCSGGTFTDFFLTSDHGMNCNMTGGSSGGPWFLSFNEASGSGVQASVNSFGYNFLPGYLFGPYFGTDAQNLYNRAQAG